MKKIHILYFLSLINTFVANAQDMQSTLFTESTSYTGIKKGGFGKCFILSFVKEKNNYAFILIDKQFVMNAKEVKFFFNQKLKTEPFTITIPMDNENIISSNKLVALPYRLFTQQLDGNDVKEQGFTMEDFIPEMMTGITDKDVDELKQKIEKYWEEKYGNH